MPSRLPALLTALAVTLGGLTALTLTTASPASAAAQVYPVPTPSAGLGRITTAPDGDMWFVEMEAQKIGRITPQGQVTEVDLDVGSESAQVKDLDIAPDGTIWVLFESGEYAVHLRPDGSIIAVQHIGAAQGAPGGGYPYGEQVRVAPDGVAWVTMSFDQQFATTVTDAGYRDVANAPPCQGPLGEAADGSMWCSNNGSLFHLPGNAGIPVGVGPSWPRAIATGPVGDIWFASATSGTFITSPSSGYVGYVTGVTSTVINTGARTGPRDLVRGPDGAMWFTSDGAAKGIGHVDAAGRGALTQVGGYAPTSLTFATDGAVWFTDATNNVIVRVPTSDLQSTNVDPGAGSVFSVGGSAGASPVTVKKARKPLAVRKGKVPLTLVCPATATAGCSGRVTLTTAKKIRKPGAKKGAKTYVALAKVQRFSIRPGAKRTVRVKISSTGTRLLRRGKATTVRVQVDGATIGKVRVRR